jgi:hypothetical protein
VPTATPAASGPPPPLSQDDRRALCPACRHVALLRRRQAELAASRLVCAQHARELLGWHDAAIVQADLTVPSPTPAGRKRPATAARVRAVDLDGTRLVDVLVRLVGPRAHHIPEGAVAPEDATPAVHGALLGRRLLLWSHQDLTHLRAAAPHQDWPGVGDVHWWSSGVGPLDHPIRARAAALQHLAATWRGQLDPHTRTLIECLPPGTPDRLLLMLQRIAATTVQQPTVVQASGEVATP